MFEGSGQANRLHPAPEPALPGFEGIKRYWDIHQKRHAAKILPGEYYVTANDELITTVLGSCISACIRDTVFAIGGMNHFMLPFHAGEQSGQKALLASDATRYGNFAMEHMINDILKNGGRRENLEVKIVGGGRILATMTDIGNKNIDFVRQYISTEGLNLIGEDVGDIYPRKVLYNPRSGQARVKKLKALHNDTIIQREVEYQHSIEDKPVTGDIELF